MQWAPYLAQGYTVQQVLDYIGKIYPSLGEATQDAQKAGRSAQEIYRWLQNFRNDDLHKLDKKYAYRSKENYLLQANEAAQKPLVDLAPIGKAALGAGIGLGVGALAARGIPALARSGIGQQIGEAIMGKGKPSLENLPPPSSGTIAPVQKEEITPGEEAEEASHPTNETLTAPKEASKSHAHEIIDRLEIGPIIESLKRAGNDPIQIAAGARLHLTPEQNRTYKAQERSGKVPPFSRLIEEYMQEEEPTENNLQEVPPVPQAPPEPVEEQAQEEKIEQPEEENKQHQATPEKPRLEKGEEVMTPHGVTGQLKEHNGKFALIDDGKTVHKVAVEEVEAIPQDYHKIELDLSKVPESERSAALSYVLPDHDNKALFVRFFEGQKPVVYKYFRKDGEPIEQSVLERIQKGLDAPITSGMRFGGAWDQKDADSRGSANFKEMVQKSEVYDPHSGGNKEKELWFVKLNPLFTHGYMQVYEEALRKAEKEFNALHNPPKRKKKDESSKRPSPKKPSSRRKRT